MPRRAFLLGGGAVLAATAAACSLVMPSDRRIEAENPPRGRFVEVDGLRIHYVEMGPPEAQPVVLLHGATGNLNDMTFDLAPRLATDLRVIAFDRPGLGYSDRAPRRGWRPQIQAEVLRRAAAALDVREPVIVGHSWGAAAALAWALQDDSVKGVALFSGATRPWGDEPGPFAAIKTSRPAAAATAAIYYQMSKSDDGASAAARIFAPQAVPEGYLAHLQPELLIRPASFQANVEDIEYLSPALAEMAPAYPTLQMPFEIMHGKEDEIASWVIHSQKLAEVLPNARLELFDGIGHMLHHALPDEAEAAVRRLCVT